MNTTTDSSSFHYNRSRFLTPTALKRPHDNSLVSFEQKLPHRISNAEEKFEEFSASLLKNKTLLVQTRLALKRQQPSLKSPKIKLEPLYTDTLQMELGNPEEFTIHNDRDDENELITLISQNTHLSREQNQMQSTSNNASALRGDSPHTIATDISLLYREKRLLSHPVTGHSIVQYGEENGGPSPCSYVLPRKSCREKNAPAFTFGARCLVEKNGGSRTGWQKQWFAHSDPYTTKVDFNREIFWPTPFHYPAKTSLGNQTTKVSFPAWSIATRLPTNTTVTQGNNPGPDTYDTISAFRKLTRKNTQITLKSRSGGSQVSATSTTDSIPGPNAYDEKKFLSNKYSAPKHSFGRRTPISYAQDPYVNTLPSIIT